NPSGQIHAGELETECGRAAQFTAFFGFDYLAGKCGSARNGENAMLEDIDCVGGLEDGSGLKMGGVERLIEADAKQGSGGHEDGLGGSVVIGNLAGRLVGLLRRCAIAGRRRWRRALVRVSALVLVRLLWLFWLLRL